MFSKKNLKNIGLILPLIFVSAASSCEALQIVYPKSINTQINANSTFFIGNTEPGAILKINNHEVKVYDNGAFVEVVPLENGCNKFEIESVFGNGESSVKQTQTYIIQKPEKKNVSVQKEEELVEFSQNEFSYMSAIKNHVPLRTAPNNNAKRVTHISKGTVLMVNGKKGNYYRVSLNPEKNLWVQADHVVNYSTINSKMLANVNNVSVTEDKLYTYIKTDISFAVPYIITETDKGLNVDLFNVNEHPSDTKIFKSIGNVRSFAINNIMSDNQSTYFIELTDKLWGYHAYYEDNALILKIRKTPQIDNNKPLKNITIAIDAGHGGKDSGAIGPTCVKEKEINLDIAQRLKTLLEKSGAVVIMTRDDDSYVDLYDRTDSVEKTDALIFLSLHANALPDGLNPYEKHGTSVYYYNNEAKELANSIKSAMVNGLELRDDGTRYGNFAVLRTTMPLAVLIETAYMINPEEYILLLKDDFRQKAAESIKTGVENYLLNSVNINSKNFNR